MKRLLDPDSLRALARGCAVLGAGGGGDPYIGMMQALQATEDFGLVTLVDLDELPDEGLLMPCGMIGAPTVSIEKILNGDEGGRLREHLEFMTGRRVAALMAAEIGGSNGLVPISWAARMGLPVVDAGGMGRAFSGVPQGAMHLAGISPSPAGVAGGRRNPVRVRPVFRAAGGAAGARPGARLGAGPDHGAGQRDRRRDPDRAGQVRAAGHRDRLCLRSGLADREGDRGRRTARVRLRVRLPARGGARRCQRLIAASASTSAAPTPTP